MKVVEFVSIRNEKHLVLIFGLGLIGTSILERIVNTNLISTSIFPFSWNDFSLQNKDFQKINSYLKEFNEKYFVDIIWSAGVGGFFSTNENLEIEFRSYKNVLEFTNNISKEKKNFAILFHLFSSAGGLFEGKSVINNFDKPHPLRPYSDFKLKQENLLIKESYNFNYKIYRPSTVYGFYPNTRQSLISTIVTKTIKNEFLEIFASKSSLRDYILVDDIAFFVKKIILSTVCETKKTNELYFLASGKPTSIEEIIDLTSKIMNRNIFSSFIFTQKNSLNTTFSQKIIPIDLYISNLDFGIKKTHDKIINNLL
jgi:nucleoside-diphosphate-sugar epimerase